MHHIEQMGLVDGSTILDLGCGTGKQSIDLARRNCRVTAVNLSAGSIAAVRQRASDLGLATITTVLCDLDDVAEKVSGKFDGCISAYAIYYARQPAPLFQFSHDRLRCGGVFFFCGPAPDNNMEMKAFLTAIGHSFVPGAAPLHGRDRPETGIRNIRRRDSPISKTQLFSIRRMHFGSTGVRTICSMPPSKAASAGTPKPISGNTARFKRSSACAALKRSASPNWSDGFYRSDDPGRQPARPPERPGNGQLH